MSVRCRPAIAAERKALEDLQWRASLNNPGDRDALLANPDAIELPAGYIDDGHVFVAERDGTVLGFATILPREDGHIELDALFVDPPSWKQGIGRLLIDYCVDVVRARGARELHVVGNPHAEGFYRACGFEHVGTFQTRFGPGMTFRLMVRS